MIAIIEKIEILGKVMIFNESYHGKLLKNHEILNDIFQKILIFWWPNFNDSYH